MDLNRKKKKTTPVDQETGSGEKGSRPGENEFPRGKKRGSRSEGEKKQPVSASGKKTEGDRERALPERKKKGEERRPWPEKKKKKCAWGRL